MPNFIKYIGQTLTMGSINRYDSTRFGGLDDTGNFFSIDLANQQALVASDQGLGIKRRLTLDPDGNLRIYSLNNAIGHGQFPGLQCLSPAIFMACVVQMGSAAIFLHLHALAHLGM
jgi:hypothetical protein